jgi:hydroxypyruvate isomerase
LKQSFSWWSFVNRGLSDSELLSEAKAIGYSGVELIDERLFDEAIGVGLEIVTHNGHGSIDNGLNDLANHDRIEHEIEENLAVAAKYGIQNLIVFSGCRSDDLTDSVGLANTVAGLRRLAPLAESAGVTLILELLNSRVDHPYYQCDSTAWAVSAIDQTESSSVKILYDIYHAQVMEGDLIRTIHCCYPYVGHYHTAGCPGRHELDQHQEIYYPAVLKAVAETGYDGYVGHEFIPTTHPRYGLIAAYELTEVATSLKS